MSTIAPRLRYAAAASVLLAAVLALPASAQVDARMLRQPDVSADRIAFVYAGDIWVAPKEGGTAQRLSSPAGEEMFPRFSPDGASIAFTGNYDGNLDVYVVPTAGGAPTRVTWDPAPDVVTDWYGDGQSLLFVSPRKSGVGRVNQLYRVSRRGGLAERLPIEYVETAAPSPDGDVVAFMMKSRDRRTWKRYRGGMAPDIHTFDLTTHASAKVVAPTFRLYNPDGTWFAEGYGVAPDIEVPEDVTALAAGRDPQIERAVDELLRTLQANPLVAPDRPAPEDRSRPNAATSSSPRRPGGGEGGAPVNEGRR